MEELIGRGVGRGVRSGPAYVITMPWGSREHIAAICKAPLRSVLVLDVIVGEVEFALNNVIAVVSDEGGRMPHGARTCVEFNVPFIAGTKNATKLIKTGDYVEVLGDAGLVRYETQRNIR